MTLEERLHALSVAPEFRNIPAKAGAALAAAMREEHLAAGEIVLSEGERADRVFVLCEGVLELTQAGRLGVVRRLGRGALLGELAFFSDEVRTATVRAASDGILLSLPFENFRAFLLANPESLLIFAGRIVSMLRSTEAELVAARDLAEKANGSKSD
jgi:CRP-like cAMP-binding protein